MKLFAQFVSFLFHPLSLMFMLPYFVVFRQTANIFSALKWQLFTSAFIIAAVILFFIGKRQGIFSDYDISKREERPKFYFIVMALAVAYLLSALFFKGILFPLSIIAFGICAALIAFAIVSYRLKASGHVAVACAFVLTMGSMYGQSMFMALVWIIPLVAWSRFYLKRHTVHEIIAGGVLVTIITSLTFLVGKYLYGFLP